MGAAMATGYLTTHVLATARGSPAAGIEIELYRRDGAETTLIATATTNTDGRTDTPILSESDFKAGQYTLNFKAGGYLRATGQAASEPLFLDDIPIAFGMSEDAHYHVPLLLSPHGYSTYRGS